MDNSKQLKPSSAPQTTEKHSKKNIIIGTVVGYITFGLSIISGLLYTPWIIQSIGKSNYGLYTLATSLISLFLLDFGLSVTANTYFAKLRASGNTDELRRLVGVFLKLYLLIDLVILIGFTVVYFLIDYIYVGLLSEERESFKNIFIIAACFSVIAFPSTVFSGVISAYEEFVSDKIIDLVNKVLYIVFTAIAISFGWGLIAIVTINSGVGLISIILRIFVVSKKICLHIDLSEKLTKAVVKPILIFSFWASVSTVAARLVFNITPSILGIVSDSTNISVFGVASSLEAYVYTFGSVMSGFFLPKITRIGVDSENDFSSRLMELSIKVGKIQLAILSLILVGFASCGEDFILLWMHGDTTYTPAYWGTLMMISYDLILIPEIVFYTAMYAQNKIKHLAYTSILKAILNLGLSFCLSYFFGALGACVSITIARFFELIMQNVYYKKDLGVNLPFFFKKVFPKILLCAAFALLAGLLSHFFLPLSAAPKFFVEVCIVIVVYCPLVVFIGFSRGERSSFVASFLKRK